MSTLLQHNTNNYTQMAAPTKWTKEEAHIHFTGPFKQDTCFYLDLLTGEAWQVDTDTDNLTEQEIIDHWGEVEHADKRN